MVAISIRIPNALLATLDTLADEIYTTRASLIRQSIKRNIDIIQNVERPAIREHYRKQIPKLH